MGFDQYHEPPEELAAETRTFARLCASLTEEAEAIGWYAQRLDVERDADAEAIMRDAQGEEFKHFAMDLEFLLRRTPRWKQICEGVLFKDGDIVEQVRAIMPEGVDVSFETWDALSRTTPTLVKLAPSGPWGVTELNAAGGVLGKMLSPQNLAIAAVVVGMEHKEHVLLRKVLWWSLGLLLGMCVLVYLQSTPVLGWMVVS